MLLGEEQVRDTVTVLNPGEAEAFQFKARNTGTTQSAHIYLGGRNTAMTLVAGLYGSAAGKPGTLITTGTLSGLQPGAWNTVPVAAQQLVAGNTYWLAVLGTGGQLRIRDRHEGSCTAADTAVRSSALSGTWRTSSVSSTCPVSGYVTGTAAVTEPKLKEPIAEQPPVSEPPLSEPPVQEPPKEEPPKEAPPAAPANTQPPSISGTAQEGQTLAAGTGSWTGSPTSFAYQWQDCDALGASCANVAGATAAGYVLAGADAGHTVRVVVTATNAGGSTAASSAPSAVVAALPPAPPVNTGLPAISGTPIEGQTLTASSGGWSGAPSTFAYQWQDCNLTGGSCVNVAGAGSPGYTLGAADVGHTVRVLVTASNAGGGTSASSAATIPVTGIPPLPPVNTGAPVVSGSAVEGQTLSASKGTWTGSPTSFSYQWQSCNTLGLLCSNISGATGVTYLVQSADAGQTLRVIVTATGAGGSTEAASAQTAAVLPSAPVNTALPAISGNAVEGQALEASNGSWNGSPSSFTYQWQRCNGSGGSCSNIASATGAGYTLLAADTAHTLRVVVTAKNAGGSTQATSAASTTVLPQAPANTALPAISGTTVSGQSLTAGTGSWTGSPTSFAYQWQRCNSAGASCAAIAGAASSSFTLGAADVGHTLRAQVTASNAGGSGSATSAASAPVSEATSATGCFANPESCGYPGTANTGANCSALTPSGSIVAGTTGQKVENLNITGTITVTASKVTINNVCVTTNGGAKLGSSAVFLGKGATETTITNSTIRGENETNHSVEEALSNNYGNAGATASKVQLYNCGECLHQTWTLTKSYVNVTGMKGTTDHYEDWYYSDATIVASEDTLLNPQEQTAVLFGDTHVGGGGPCDNHLTVTGSLIAGGGALFYPCGNASSVGSSTMTIKNNRFARCTGAHQYEPESGGTLCAGGSDSHGYYPYGGFFMTAAYIYSGAGQVWEGNVWDDNNEAAAP